MMGFLYLCKKDGKEVNRMESIKRSGLRIKPAGLIIKPAGL